MRESAYKYHVTQQAGPKLIRWCSDQQKEAFEYGPAPLCLSGGFGSGKTIAACYKALAISDMFPGNRGVIARREWDDLEKTTMQTFFKICPPAAYLHGGQRNEKYLRLNNGSEILWMHLRLNDPHIEDIIKGLEINWFIFDQAEDMEEELFDKMRSRLGRWDQTRVPEHIIKAAGGYDAWEFKDNEGRPVPPTYSTLTCNPDVEYHWIFRRFHSDSPEWREGTPGRPSYRENGYKMIIMNSLDNIFLTDQTKRDMMMQDEAFVRRYVKGEWGLPEGRIHALPDQSIVPYTPERVQWIRESCRLLRILDHGDSAPTAVGWAGVDQAGNVIFFREYYQPNKLVSDHRREITKLSEGERYTFNLADPSIFLKQQQKHGGRWCTADEYGDTIYQSPADALYWMPADNNEFGTRNRISEYLRVDPDHINPFTKEKGAPRLYFIERHPDYPQGCDHLIRELRAQRRTKIGTELGKPIFSDERDEKIPDHAYDLVRYCIASRPPIAIAPRRLYSKRSFKYKHQELIKLQKAGGMATLTKLVARDKQRTNAQLRAYRHRLSKRT